jgi:hypothetical protein
MTDARRHHLDAVEAVVKAFHYEPYDMAEEIVRLRAAIERVQVLHRQDPERKHCWECQYGLPCRTLRAIDGEGA